jgi:hypothetical protein
MLTFVLTLALLTNHAATPQAAALQAVSFGVKRPPTVVRTNVVGRYATILLSGGVMEGGAVTAPILLERFSFGWQPLDLLNFRCSLESHRLGKHVEVSLMRGMPKPEDGTPCTERRDAGSTTEVEAVRRLMTGPLVPFVAVSKGWALGEWYGAGGGESLYRLRGGQWNVVSSVGGAMGILEMRRYGVPQSDWCIFGTYDAKCH